MLYCLTAIFTAVIDNSETIIESAADITAENSAVISHVFEVIPKIAKDLGLDNGFRIINNCGKDGGQTVGHIHFHILGGKTLGEGLV